LSKNDRTDENVEKSAESCAFRRLSINQAYYVEILKRLREAVCRKRSELWSNDWILHRDAAPAHKTLSLSIRFWPKNRFRKWNTHSVPLIWLRDWLFTKINSALKERRFHVTDIQKNVTTAPKAVPQQEFQKRFQQWHCHWAKCIAVQKEYIEGDLLSKL
jgi:hypothetical protein